jgi:hypothetical protein
MRLLIRFGTVLVQYSHPGDGVMGSWSLSPLQHFQKFCSGVGPRAPGAVGTVQYSAGTLRVLYWCTTLGSQAGLVVHYTAATDRLYIIQQRRTDFTHRFRPSLPTVEVRVMLRQGECVRHGSTVLAT